jgi:secondary thiamine-phosphate synthase enzyme
MRQALHVLRVRAPKPGLFEITREVVAWVGGQGIGQGLLTLFCRHTSASLLIQENADPDVCRDLQDFFAHLAANGMNYRHTAEGPDDMPSHIRSALTQTSIGIPLHKGRPVLGTWQGIYVFEHRDAPHRREVTLHVLGE